MKNEYFDQVLQKNENILWTNGVNKKSFLIKASLRGALYSALASLFLGSIISMPLLAFSYNSDISNIFQTRILVWLFIFLIGMIITTINANLNSKNTFFAITDKRIILRSGAFSNRYTHYSLKNVGNIQVVGNVFDSKGPNGSANLVISTKDFHTNTDGNKAPRYLTVISLEDAYSAYRIITEKTEGNNEVFRVKNVE